MQLAFWPFDDFEHCDFEEVSSGINNCIESQFQNRINQTVSTQERFNSLKFSRLVQIRVKRFQSAPWKGQNPCKHQQSSPFFFTAPQPLRTAGRPSVRGEAHCVKSCLWQKNKRNITEKMSG